MDRFTQSYIRCALWTSTDESDDSGGDPMDDNYSQADLTESAIAKISADCERFQVDHDQLLERAYLSDDVDYNPESAGHDFWLTRNGHGAGFWDRGLGALGDKLSEAAKAYRNCDLYVTDDDRIDIM